MNREQWLEEAAGYIRQVIATTTQFVVPPFNVSCGFPSKRALVEDPPLSDLWFGDQTNNGVAQIYISPLVDDYKAVTTALVYEICRLCTDTRKGKSKELTALFKMLEPNMEIYGGSIKTLNNTNPYNHSAVIVPEKKKKQGTRLRKISCDGFDEHQHETYILRGSAKVIAMGLPDCPVCGMKFFLQPEDEPESEE